MATIRIGGPAVRASSFASSLLQEQKGAQAPVTKIQLRDKKTINVNDHIYLSAPWAPGAGDPYVIGRVMEFVNPAANNRQGQQPAAQHAGPVRLQVRVNVFLRMRDISSRPSHDPRLLVATMHSDLFSTDNIRGKCEVRHRDLIGDGSAPEISTWKKREDHFWYHQLYDRYIHRFYDVILTDKIKNAPPDVLTVLRERYSFVIAEVGMTQDLCDALRGCLVCHRWAASAHPGPQRTADEDVRGVRCFNNWPYRYFGQHTAATDVLDPHDSIYPRATTRLGPKFQAVVPTWEEQIELGVGANALAKAAVAMAKQAKQLQEIENGGVGGSGNSSKEVGLLPAALGSSTAGLSGTAESTGTAVEGEVTPAVLEPNKTFKGVKRKRDDDGHGGTGTSTPSSGGADSNELPERGGDETITPIFSAERFARHSAEEANIDQYLRLTTFALNRIPPYNMELLATSLEVFMMKNGNCQAAMQAMADKPLSELNYVEWEPKEIKRFEAGLTDWGADMNQLKKLLPGKTVAQIVRFYYSWKTAQLRDQWKAEQAAQHSKNKAKPKDPEFYTATSAGTTRAVSPTLSVMEFPTAGTSAVSHAHRSCFMCNTTSSALWYKGPASWSNRALCVGCGVYWRKYAAESTPSLELIATNKKPAVEENGLGVQLPVLSAKSREMQAPARQPVPKPEAVRCVFCRRIEPKRKLITCIQCSMTVHIGCHGVDDREFNPHAWLCEPCLNEKMRFANLNPECVLCPAREAERLAATNSNLSAAMRRTKSQMLVVRDEKEEAAPQPLTALEAVKPTESNNWAHTLCAVWIPEIAFSNATSLKDVEGAGYLPTWRYQAVCEPDYTFAFEIQPVKSSRRDAVPTVSFKEETGNMSALIWCKDHRDQAKLKKIYEQHEIDSRTGLSVLQLYARTHKTMQAIAPTVAAASTSDVSYALLRRAKRLDAITSSGTAIGAATGVSSSHHLHAHRSSSGFGPAIAGFGMGGLPITTAGGPSAVAAAMLVMEENSRKKNKLGPPYECVRCKTHYSPGWWPLVDEDRPEAEAEAEEEGEVTQTEETTGRVGSMSVTGVAIGPPNGRKVCCNRCRALVRPDLHL
ncbi:unnamed protein product [Tilletia controversa]|nr:unnamed protein product [Tilletia controversa]